MPKYQVSFSYNASVNYSPFFLIISSSMSNSHDFENLKMRYYESNLMMVIRRLIFKMFCTLKKLFSKLFLIVFIVKPHE